MQLKENSSNQLKNNINSKLKQNSYVVPNGEEIMIKQEQYFVSN